MKKGLVLLTVFLMSSIYATAGPDPNFYVFLCFGQSNMDGAGRIEQQDKTVDERFQVLAAFDDSNLNRKKGNWYPAVPPLCRPTGGLGPADYFGRTMVASLPEKIRIGVINVSIPGCKIELFEKDTYQTYAETVEPWMKNFIKDYDGNPYQYLVDMARTAQKDGVIKGILLHQGESNSNDWQWPKKVKGVYDNLIKDLNLDPDDVPLLAGETVNADQQGVCAGMNKIIAELPKELNNSYVISSAGCACKSDHLHFNSAGNRELGKRYAERMLSTWGGTIQFVETADSLVFPAEQSTEKVHPVGFNQFEYSGEDTYAASPLKPGYYRNPILAGFHPDPSLCRVGEDYYLINSTFEYFPGLPIFHCTDLVNWKQIGHVIHRAEQLDYKGRRTSNGLFAPAISYHDGIFYVVCTMVDGFGNFVVTAKNPAGPWSDPISVGFQGIDPSIFFDDDGRAWIVNNDAPEGPPMYNGHRAIWVQEFDYKAMKMIGPRKMLVNGGVDISKKPIWIEGPHLYKHNGWYYLCCAEGGTAADHSQVILRSKTVDGPYIPWDKNPILTQRDLNSNVLGAVTCTGHADLEIGPDGRWWAVFLAVRPYEGRFSPMGRETFLLPVNWTDDGWPVILQSGQRVPLVEKGPGNATVQSSTSVPLNGSFTWRDDFNEKNLSMEWIMLREPQEEWWKIDSKAGKLEIIPQSEKLYGTGNPSYLGRRVRHDTYNASLAVEVPKEDSVSAGIALFMTEKYHYFLAVKRSGDNVSIYLESVIRGQLSQIASKDLLSVNEIDLRIKARKSKCSFQYKTKGHDWETLAEDVDATVISFTVQDGLFLGATIGPHVRIDGE